MATESPERLSPLVFVVGGAIALGAVGFALDLTFGGSGSTLAIDGPLSEMTTYNFTLLGAIVGGILGGFVGFGWI